MLRRWVCEVCDVFIRGRPSGAGFLRGFAPGPFLGTAGCVPGAFVGPEPRIATTCASLAGSQRDSPPNKCVVHPAAFAGRAAKGWKRWKGGARRVNLDGALAACGGAWSAPASHLDAEPEVGPGLAGGHHAVALQAAPSGNVMRHAGNRWRQRPRGRRLRGRERRPAGGSPAAGTTARGRPASGLAQLPTCHVGGTAAGGNGATRSSWGGCPGWVKRTVTSGQARPWE